jgi:hypothetical protein
MMCIDGNNYGAFLDIRALRLTCRWFAQHVTLGLYTTHSLFWPAVEDYIDRGYTSALFGLDWPTHPGCSLQNGYAGPNYSFGRAGHSAVLRNDIRALSLLLLHGNELWSSWITDAIRLKRMDVVRYLLTDPSLGSRYQYWSSPSCFSYDTSPEQMAIMENNFEALTLLGKAGLLPFTVLGMEELLDFAKRQRADGIIQSYVHAWLLKKQEEMESGRLTLFKRLDNKKSS